jgi:multiple sugar transport system substrate-binding protein
MWVESQPLYYNQELLDQAGLSIPTTMDELEAAAAAIHAPDQEIYGWATRGVSPLNTSAILPALLSYGGNWLDSEGRAALNSPEAVQAVEWYARMLRQYGPPAPETLDVARWSDLFKAGQVGLAVDSPSFIGPFSDAASSAIVGKYGIATWPAGPAGSRSSLWTWSMTIGKFSEKKEAAWYYVQWHTMKERVLGMAGTGVMPSRNSVATGSDWTPLLPNLPQFRTEALENGIVDAFPQVTVVAQARQLLGDAVVKAIQGDDVQASLDEANGLFQELIDSQG